MTILSAQSIKKYGSQIIDPFWPVAKTSNGRSYGLSPAGYDVRINQTIWLWPFWGRLASTVERFTIPPNIAGEIKDKSSNARIFVLVQNTFIDPGWSGYLTLELTRFKLWPIRIKAGTPIAQIIFHHLDEPTINPYNGKYQNQMQSPQPAIISVKP